MKQAICIITFNNYEILRKIILLYDSEDIDFYIHVNKLVALPNIGKIKSFAKKSKIIFTERYEVVWGEEGIMRAQLITLMEAYNSGNYEYYHVISGQDFPLKSLKSLNDFLQKNMYNNITKKYKTNYIEIKQIPDKSVRQRVEHYNFLICYWRNPNKLIRGSIRLINLIAHSIQSIFNVNRLKRCKMELYWGSLWYSLSNEFVEYLSNNLDWFSNNFDKHSFGVDEIAMHTFFMNSKFSKSRYIPIHEHINANLRYLDFKRGNGASPYVFTYADKKELEETNNFFARKFMDDSEIIDYFFNKLKTK